MMVSRPVPGSPFIAVLTFVLLSAAPLGAAAPPPALDSPVAAEGALTVDGFFQDWGARAGLRGDQGPSLRWELRSAHTSQRVYLVFGARDDAFVPSSGGPSLAALRGDLVILHLPEGTVALLPGDLEDRPPQVLPSSSLARRGGGAGEIDGATRPGGGWLLEVSLPLAWVQAGQADLEQLRVELEVQDQDPGQAPKRSRQTLLLRLPEWEAHRAQLLTDLGLPPHTQPRWSQKAQVGGDERQEQVLVYPKNVCVLGEGLGEATYTCIELPFAGEGVPTGLETRDLDGDGAVELLLSQELRRPGPGGEHKQSFLTVYQFADGVLQALHTLETEHWGPASQWVKDRVEVLPPRGRGRRRKPGGLRLRFAEASTMDIHDYQDPDAGLDLWYQPILLPWSEPRSLEFRCRDGRLLREP